MKVMLLSLVLASSAICQTSKPAPVNACQTALKATAQAVDSLSADLTAARAENERLRAVNAELQASTERLKVDNRSFEAINTDLAKKNETLKTSAVALLESDSKQYAELVEKYNDLLQRANSVINTQNARLARQQQVNNALAIYGALPKQPQTVNVNVSDCSKYPALCVH